VGINVGITHSSGNVFEDAGFPRDEARKLLIRSYLMSEIMALMESRQLTQARAATLFGVSQPRISDLMRGKIDLFSIDTLLAMLFRAGAHVLVKVQRKAA